MTGPGVVFPFRPDQPGRSAPWEVEIVTEIHGDQLAVDDSLHPRFRRDLVGRDRGEVLIEQPERGGVRREEWD